MNMKVLIHKSYFMHNIPLKVFYASFLAEALKRIITNGVHNFN